MQPTPTGRVRPQGVTILAILAAIGGVLGILGSLALIGLGGVLGAAGGGLFGGMTMLFGLGALVVAVLELGFAYGAWTLKPWGWILGIVVAIASLALSLLVVVGGGDITGQIISIVVAVAIIYYLNTPNVKAAFGRA